MPGPAVWTGGSGGSSSASYSKITNVTDSDATSQSQSGASPYQGNSQTGASSYQGAASPWGNYNWGRQHARDFKH